MYKAVECKKVELNLDEVYMFTYGKYEFDCEKESCEKIGDDTTILISKYNLNKILEVFNDEKYALLHYKDNEVVNTFCDLKLQGYKFVDSEIIERQQ